jgi:tight adherence protein B
MREALYDSAWGPLAVAVAVGCLMLVAALVALARPRGAWLRDRLGAYDGPTDGTTGGAPVGATRLSLQSLYGATERRLDHTRLWTKANRIVDRAHVGLSTAELLFLSAGVGLGLAVLTAALGQSGLVVALALAGGVAIVPVWLTVKGDRRRRRFDEQLPDTLQTMAGSLKVGHSFNQSIQVIVDKGTAPASQEFDRLLSETRLGQPMDEALANMAARIGSADLEFVLMSVRIQRQVGGSLAGLFETVAETVRERQHFRRKVRALTATARMSAYVLALLPVVTALLITVVSPGYLNPLFTTSSGQLVIVLCLVSMGIGATILRRIASVKG